jgi:hypothetical protein
VVGKVIDNVREETGEDLESSMYFVSTFVVH